MREIRWHQDNERVSLRLVEGTNFSRINAPTLNSQLNCRIKSETDKFVDVANVKVYAKIGNNDAGERNYKKAKTISSSRLTYMSSWAVERISMNKEDGSSL